MPLSPESIERLKASGQLQQVMERAAEAYVRGIDVPGINILESMRGLHRDDPNDITLHVPVILVDFRDNEADRDEYHSEHYEELLFSTDELDPGSMREFYLENSYDEVNIIGEVVGWARLPQTYAYYVDGQNGTGRYPCNSQGMTRDAVRAVDNQIDFSEFDNDDDGTVDAIFVVHAGPGAESNDGDEDMIWSHAWALNNYRIRLDGVWIDGYSTEPEDGQVGVFGHELGHALFGLVDVYDRDYESEGLGNWSMMAGGAWGGDGASPAHFDAWCKIQAGFIEPVVLERNMNSFAIPPVELEDTVYILWNQGEFNNEYFIIENRQQIGFDASLPGSGLLIYHVDEEMDEEQNDNEWYPGHQNDGHYLVALEQADGNWDLEQDENRGDEGDPYPGDERNQTFNNNSTPNSRDYSGDPSGVAISNIRIIDGIVICRIQVDPDGDFIEGLFINEIQSDNNETIADPQDEFEDWIELYNGSEEEIDLTGIYLTDDVDDPDQWEFPEGTTIDGGGFLLIWADRDVNDEGLHSNFTLSSGGETIGLYISNGDEFAAIDIVEFPELETDWSYGRRVDGGANWMEFDNPTPGGSNQDQPPEIEVDPQAIESDNGGVYAITIRNVGDSNLLWRTELEINEELNEWISWDPQEGVLRSGEEEDITVILSSEGLDEGVYEADLIILSNDPENPEVTIHITLEISDEEAPELRHFTDFVQTDSNHSLLITDLMFEDEDVPAGWEVGVFTPDNLLSGAGVWQEDDLGFPAWGDEAETEEIEGFRDGEQLNFRVWDDQADEEYGAVPNILQGPDVWAVNGFTVLRLEAAGVPDLRHFTDFMRTDSNHSILITDLSFEEEDVPTGWEIGIFTPDNLLAGGGVWVDGERLGVPAWGDEGDDEEINGFRAGEQINFRAWDDIADEEYATIVEIEAGPANWQANGFTALNLTASEGRDLVVQLNTGWNMISINVSPPEEFYAEDEERGPDIRLMTDQLRIDEDNHRLVLMKDEMGRFYSTAWDFNNIPYWNLTEGYQVNTAEDVEAVWSGVPIAPDADIPITEGWNMIAYFPTYELSVAAPDFYGISPIIDHVDLLKDAVGHFVSPAWNFSNVPPLHEGQGYQIKVDEDVVLNYPEEEEIDNCQLTIVNFRLVRTSENMSVLITSLSGIEVNEGDQIAAFNVDNLLVGVGMIDNDGRCGVAIWGDESSTEEIDGIAEGEAFELRFWDTNFVQETALSISTILAGAGLIYECNSFSALEMIKSVSIPEEFYLSTAYPNPFNAVTRLSYGLPEAARVSIRIYDVSGRMITRLVDSEQSAGHHSVTWDGKAESSGVYLVKMNATDGFSDVRKVVLVK